jgi:uncharacterized protein (DUF1697 family)
MVALLRGVNVGGRSGLAMSDLRNITEAAGFAPVRTYIQSGNVVFGSRRSDTMSVAKALRAAIAQATSLDPDIAVRTRAELAAIVRGNPYLKRGADPAHLHVVFLTGATKAAKPKLELDCYAPESVTAKGRELYLLLPNGIGRSKLAADLARGEGATGTARNWRTVTKLLEMADELE